RGGLFPALKGNLFGVPAVLGALAFAVVAAPGEPTQAPGTGYAARSIYQTQHSCTEAPRGERDRSRQGIATVRGAESDPECNRPNMDTLRYVVPGPPGAADPGPPVHI